MNTCLIGYRKYVSVWILVCYAAHALSQQIVNSVGAIAWSRGGASVTSQDIWSVWNNPAGISHLKTFQAGIYSEQRFHESKLSTASAAIVIPTKFIHTGFSIHHVGYSLFNQQKISATLSKKLMKQCSIGATFSYLGTHISEQEPAGNIIGEIGLMYQISAALRLGVFVFNPTQSKYSTHSIDKIPTYSRIGLAYDVSEKLHLLGEVEQTLNRKTIMRAGIHYQLHDNMSLSVGGANNPVYYTFGTSIKWKILHMDFAASVHEILGVTPHIGLSFPVKK
jgi:long-subunit fatty acid transport protein